jgi:hypothetical protein
VIPAMSGDEFEEEMIRRANAGDHTDGREALRRCATGLMQGNLSRRLSDYLATCLMEVDIGLNEADALKEVKKSSGSVNSARYAAITEALRINRPAKKPLDPMPAWHVPYAALGELLRRDGLQPEQINAKLDEARRMIDKNDRGLDRREAQRIRVTYEPLCEFDHDTLLHLAGPLREILPTFLPQEKER